MTTLVSLLGRARAHPDTGYRTATYRFPDGDERTGPFFGLLLAEHLGAERLVILGTAGSMWDVLVEHLARTEPGRDEDERLALYEAAQAQVVTEEHLARLQPLVEGALGRRVDLLLIPYARDLDEQEDLLDRLADTVRDDHTIHFDVTHGLRHLPMLSLVAAHLLETLNDRLSVEEIWYGALDLTENGLTPVLRLQGLMRLQAWIEAWRRYEDDGDYGVIADLLEQEGVDPDRVTALRRAAHFERILDLPDARRHLQHFLPVLERPLPGPARLFARRLRERLDWVRRGDLYAHQRKLAFMHLGKGDYLRAAILAVEAVLTRWMSQRGEGDPNQYEDRQRAREALRQELLDARRDDIWDDYRTLEHLRNALAHASAPPAHNRRLRQLLQNPERLDRELQRLISRLLT